MNYRGLNIPFVSFGSVTSDDLFAPKEQAIFDFFEANKERYRRALDVGANIGVHTLLMVQQGWEVWAFEPDPEHYRIWQQNCGHLPKDKVACSQMALSDRNGVVTFVRVKGNTTGSHIKGDKQPYGELDEFQVSTRMAFHLFEWADFAKIDAEGAEARILSQVQPHHRCEYMVEVGNEKNAGLIWDHFRQTDYSMWAQKLDWGLCKELKDIPKHHSEGALFIGRKPPLG